MWLKRMAVAAVRRRVRLEGGGEAEEVDVERKKWSWKPGREKAH